MLMWKIVTRKQDMCHMLNINNVSLSILELYTPVWNCAVLSPNRSAILWLAEAAIKSKSAQIAVPWMCHVLSPYNQGRLP